MAVGFGGGLVGLVFLLIAVATVVWLWRGMAAGEIGLMGGGLAPVVRRARQPRKFWVVISAAAIFVLMPAVLLAYFFLNLLDWPV